MTIAETGVGQLLQREGPDVPAESFLDPEMRAGLQELLEGSAPTGRLTVVDDHATETWLISNEGLAARVERRTSDANGAGERTSWITTGSLLPLAIVHELGLADRGPMPDEMLVASRRWLVGSGGAAPPGAGSRRVLIGDPTGTTAVVIVPSEPAGYLLGVMVGDPPEVPLVPASGLDVWHQILLLASSTTSVSSPPG